MNRYVPVKTRPPEVSTTKLLPDTVKPKPATKGTKALMRKIGVRNESSILEVASPVDQHPAARA